MKSVILAQKEVKIFLQDRGDLAFSILLPIAIFLLMYSAFGGQYEFHGTLHLVNLDPEGSYSLRFLDILQKTEQLEIEEVSLSEADRKLERSDILFAVVIPEDFSVKLHAGTQSPLTFKQRGNGGQEGQIVASIVRGAAEKINQELHTIELVHHTLADRNMHIPNSEQTVRKLLAREQAHPIVQISEEIEGTIPDPAPHFLPGIVSMFVLFSITLSARTIVEERKKGTLERLLTTQLSTGDLFGGKFIANILKGFIQSFIILALAWTVFHIFTPVSFIHSLIVILMFAGAASVLGLVISSIARTEDQSVWISVLVTMGMVMIGGTFFSIPAGSILDTISRISLNTYANRALKEVIVRGGSLLNVWQELAILGSVIIAGLILARILFRPLSGKS
jgi:ABC-type Na+ efflux pump permease subunit